MRKTKRWVLLGGALIFGVSYTSAAVYLGATSCSDTSNNTGSNNPSNPTGPSTTKPTSPYLEGTYTSPTIDAVNKAIANNQIKPLSNTITSYSYETINQDNVLNFIQIPNVDTLDLQVVDFEKVGTTTTFRLVNNRTFSQLITINWTVTPPTEEDHTIPKEDIVPANQSKYNTVRNNMLFTYSDQPTTGAVPKNEVYNFDSLYGVKYKADGFKYPAWNFNYEEGENKYITVNGARFNMRAELMNEKTPEGTKYSDPNWIINQINAGTLKRHPAANIQYEQDIDKIQTRVDRTFKISTASKGLVALGIWAPAGNPVEIQFDQETWDYMKATNYEGIEFIINDNFYDTLGDTQENGDLELGGISTRYPYICSNFKFTKDYLTANDANRTIKIGSPFGGVINLNIKYPLRSGQFDPFFNSTQMLKFTVRNVYKTLFYYDNIVTEQNWNQQLDEVRRGNVAPNFSGGFTYGTVNIPFTKPCELGGWEIDKLNYPASNFKTIDDFMFLSNYFNARDITKSFIRIDFQISLDIKSGGAAWGGWDCLKAPYDWVMGNFFGPTDTVNWWTFTDTWGFMHEINHNFVMDESYFKFVPKMHSQANQVNVFDQAFIGNASRWRSEHNPAGNNNSSNWKQVNGKDNFGWDKLTTVFSNLLAGKCNPGSVDEYSMYKAIWSMVGPIPYAKVARFENLNARNDRKGWTYMQEIYDFSKRLGYNYWPALNKMQNRFWKTYSPIWNNDATGPENRWPENYASATEDEKKIIDKLKVELPEVDFVGNLYACGVYKYNPVTNSFDYTSDVEPAFQIPAGKPYTFDFGKNIYSWNEAFEWDKLEFSPSQLGADIKVDPNNNKKLIYTPNPKTLGQEDEFDVLITPKKWGDDNTNYVPAYKWKIKVRQETNGIQFTTYKPFANQSATSDEMFSAMSSTPIDDQWVYPTMSQNYFYDNKGDPKRGANCKFKFVCTEDGTYDFKFGWDDWGRVKLNGELIGGTDKYTKPVDTLKTITMKRGDALDFDISIINSGGAAGMSMAVLKDGKEYNYEHNVLLPDVGSLGVESDLANYITRSIYKYKPREIDMEQFADFDLFNPLPMDETYFNPIPWDQMTFRNEHPWGYDFGGQLTYENLQNFNTSWYIFNPENGESPGMSPGYPISYTFNNPTRVGAICFANNAGNWYDWTRLDEVGIVITLADGTVINQNFVYGSQFNDKTSAMTYCNLDQTYDNVKSIKLNLKADNTAYLNGVAFMNNQYGAVNQSVSLSSNAIGMNGSWINARNNPTINESCVNNSYWYTRTKGDSIEFTVQNMQGFSVIGRNFNGDGQFDVYINNELVGTSKMPNSSTLTFNDNLFTWMKHYDKPIRVRLVNKEAQPLFLNYITIYGENSSIL